MGKMVTDTMDHMDMSNMVVHMHAMEQSEGDSRDKVIEQTTDTRDKSKDGDLDSIEQELDNVDIAKLAGIEDQKPAAMI